jgi:exosortase K
MGDTTMAAKNLKPYLMNHAVYYLLILLTAWGLKFHYSRAGSDELVWVLAPTAGLVELISGIAFEKEAHTGFVGQGNRFIIAPACAGVNFLIIAFCMSAFSGMHAFKRQRSKLLWLGIAFLSAYLLTIVINALRIFVSIHTYAADIQLGWFTPARIHRLEGVVIYFFFLTLFYMIIKNAIYKFRGGVAGKKPAPARPAVQRPNYVGWVCAGLVPYSWYGLHTLVVPLINGALRQNPGRFAEHGALVLTASGAVLAIFLLTRIVIFHIAPEHRKSLTGCKRT